MTLRRCTAAVVLSTVLAFGLQGGANAATVTTSNVTASVGDVSVSSSKTSLSGDSIRFAQVLSSSYNRTVHAQDVMRLRADFDFGFGDISLIYATSVYSGRDIDEISRLRHKNMGWGEIAKLYGVKVKDLKKGNYDVVHAARERGVDVTYIEINDDDGYYRDRDNNHNRDDRDDKKDNRKNNKHDDKHDKGNGHKK
ncbi:hypothetical protein SDC9_161284 [bioreactor metagenome]|uniref:Uncharacterized protein n=1 Tax=bioreactor metagenome TaxID=1076179 RepID=A0A645FHT0_9ZZZZ